MIAEELGQAKLDALREAARLGFEDFDRGEYREFDSMDDLDRYLIDLTEGPSIELMPAHDARAVGRSDTD